MSDAIPPWSRVETTKVKGRSYLSSCNFLIDSDSEEKMGDELTILLEAFHKIEKAGGQATLSVSTSCGKTKVKLVTSTTAAPPSVSPSTSSTPGRRHRRRSARARARRNLRAAAHQASLAEAATSVPLDPPRPLHLHPSPPPASGRRQVTTVARPDVATFPTLNVDGPSSPPPAFNCDDCGERFKSGEEFVDHRLWCPRCVELTCYTRSSPLSNCYVCPRPHCGHFYVKDSFLDT